MTRPTILVDVDGVLADFVGGVLFKLAHHGFERTYESITELHLPAIFTAAECEVLDRHCKTESWCANLSWYPGAPEFLRDLCDLGNVQIVTKPWDSYHWVPERMRWLEDWMRAQQKQIPVTFAHDKTEIRGDIMIEDSANNLNTWWRPGRMAILIDRPWNRHDRRELRAYDYREVLSFVKAWSR